MPGFRPACGGPGPPPHNPAARIQPFVRVRFTDARKATAPGEPLEAIAVVSIDGTAPESVLAQLRENPAVRQARAVQV